MSGDDLSTRLIHTPESKMRRTVNPAIERASTVLFDSEEALYGTRPSYGRRGLAVQSELQAALCELESASYAALTPSGLTACALAIASVVEAGDHVLIADTLYGPTRRFCLRRLKTMGVTATRFSPRIGSAIEGLIQPNTKAIVLESPGSLTFEIPDTPAILSVAKDADVVTILDNTWSAGLFHKPLLMGVDISVQALTKYVVGHADGFGGAVLCRSNATAAKVEAAAEDWGIGLSPDDAYVALRGLRTLPTRLRAHEAAAIELCSWLRDQKSVFQVLHPALSDHPDHAIWKRDFTGSSGLFSIILQPCSDDVLSAAIAALQVFRMGFSWGGYESLLIPCDEQLNRSKDDWTNTKRGPLIRLHVGLEAMPDLKADLSRFLHHIQ
ncbi:MAG: cystathionine beta-lyase [Pseudomonadota bacterium]